MPTKHRLHPLLISINTNNIMLKHQWLTLDTSKIQRTTNLLMPQRSTKDLTKDTTQVTLLLKLHTTKRRQVGKTSIRIHVWFRRHAWLHLVLVERS